MTSKKYGFKTIVASQNLAGQRFPWTFRHLCIPAAWPLTWIFLRLGIGPNRATFIRLACLLTSFALIASGASVVREAGVALFVFALVLDNVDGCICRVTDTASFFGKFYDGVVDSIMEIPLPIVLAFGFWSVGGASEILVSGVIASVAFTLTQITMLRFGLINKDVMALRERGEPFRPAFPKIGVSLTAHPATVKLVEALEVRLPNLAFDYRYAGLVIAVSFGLVGPYLHILAALHTVMFVAVFCIATLRAADSLNGSRQSKTAADPAPDQSSGDTAAPENA